MTPVGLPHSEISGSKAVCASPKLIAACHVLRRFPEPRHPPCALSCLTSISGFPQKKNRNPTQKPTPLKTQRGFRRSGGPHPVDTDTLAYLLPASPVKDPPGEPQSPPVSTGTQPAATAKLHRHYATPRPKVQDLTRIFHERGGETLYSSCCINPLGCKEKGISP